jgi:tRNA (guanine37-N1)-methyltransferase
VTARIYVALIHHPVRDRAGDTIATAVTNLDVHDIARSARTYGLAGYYLVTPIEAQRRLVERILEHWSTGPGARRVPERTRALALCRLAPSLAAAAAEIERDTGARPRILVTGARATGSVLSYESARRELASGPTLLVFGTGHGLAREIVEAADGVIAPIRPGSDYNHLSVRAAVAITLDRLFGDAGVPGD